MKKDQLLIESVNQARNEVKGLVEVIKNSKIITSNELSWEFFGALQYIKKTLVDVIKSSEGSEVDIEQLIKDNQPKPKKSYYKPRVKVEGAAPKVRTPKAKTPKEVEQTK